MTVKRQAWLGRWRIVETDLWDADAIDLVGSAHIELQAKGLGTLVVGALTADLHYRVGERDGQNVVEFSWEGDDDGMQSSGWGWARLDERGVMRLTLYIHRGDKVVIAAVREAAARRVTAAKRSSGLPRRTRR